MDSEALWELLKVFLAALFASALTHLLSYRRFVQGRWWDRKVDAYENVIDALASSGHLLRTMLHIEAVGDAIEGRGEEVPSDLKERWVKACDESLEVASRVVRAAYVGDYMISRRASGALLELLGSIPDYRDIYFLDSERERSLMRVFADKVESCLEIVRAEARKDLRAKWYGW